MSDKDIIDEVFKKEIREINNVLGYLLQSTIQNEAIHGCAKVLGERLKVLEFQLANEQV